MIRVLGIDPGFAAQGLVILESHAPGAIPVVRYARHVTTKRATKQQRDGGRICEDDKRRHGQLLAALYEASSRVTLTSIAIEVYNSGRSVTGAAAKTGHAYAGALYWAMSRSWRITLGLPIDIKKRLCGNISASKIEVQAQILRRVPSLEPYMMGLSAKGREDVCDAAAHAYRGLLELTAIGVPVSPQDQEF